MPSYPQIPPGVSKELMSLGSNAATTPSQPPQMKPGSTYIQRLPSGKLAFVRRPVKVASTGTVLADAFLRYPSASCAKALQSVGKGYMLPSHGEAVYPPNPNPPNHLELNPYDYHFPNQTDFGGTRALGANTPLFCDCFHDLNDSDRAAASQPIESIYLCVNCGRFRFPAYNVQNSTAVRPALPTYVCRKCREPSDSSDCSAPGARRESHRRWYKDGEKRDGDCLSSREAATPICSKALQSRRSQCTCHSCTDLDDIGYCGNQCTNHLSRPRSSPTNRHRRRLVRANRSSSEPSDDTDYRYNNGLVSSNHIKPAFYQGQRQNGLKWNYSRGLELVRDSIQNKTPKDRGLDQFLPRESNHRHRSRAARISSSDEERDRPSRKTLRFSGDKNERRVDSRYQNTSEDSYEKPWRPSLSRTRGYETKDRDDFDDRMQRSSSERPSPRSKVRWVSPGIKRGQSYYETVSSPQSRGDYRRSSHGKDSSRWASKPEMVETRGVDYIPERNHRRRHSSQYRSTEDEWASSFKRGSPKTDAFSQHYSDGHRKEKSSRSKEPFPMRLDARSHPRGQGRFERRQPSAIDVTTW